MATFSVVGYLLSTELFWHGSLRIYFAQNACLSDFLVGRTSMHGTFVSFSWNTTPQWITKILDDFKQSSLTSFCECECWSSMVLLLGTLSILTVSWLLNSGMVFAEPCLIGYLTEGWLAHFCINRPEGIQRGIHMAFQGLPSTWNGFSSLACCPRTQEESPDQRCFLVG